MPFPRPHRGNIRTALIAAGVLLARPSPEGLVLAYLAIALGSALHLLAKGTLRLGTGLTTGGPYRFTRNPFYLANLLVDAGILLAIGRIEVAAVYVPLFAIVYHRTIRGEEAILERLFGDAYRNYRSSVPRFFPWKRPLPSEKAAERFSFSNPNLLAGIEYGRLVRFLEAPLIVSLGSALVRGLGAVSPEDRPLFLTGAVLLASLFALERALIAKLRDRRSVAPRALRRPAAAAALLAVFAAGLVLLPRAEIAGEEVRLAAGGAIGLALLASLVVPSRGASTVPNRLRCGLACLFSAWFASVAWLGIAGAAVFSVLALEETSAAPPH